MMARVLVAGLPSTSRSSIVVVSTCWWWLEELMEEAGGGASAFFRTMQQEVNCSILASLLSARNSIKKYACPKEMQFSILFQTLKGTISIDEDTLFQRNVKLVSDQKRLKRQTEHNFQARHRITS